MRTFLSLALACLVAGCGGGTAQPRHAPVRVFVAVAPMAYLAETVGGTRVQVHTLIRPGQDPHHFEPGPRLSSRLADARLYFAVGLPFEVSGLPRLAAAHPALEVIDTAREIRSSGGEIRDPHVWTSPLNAARIAGEMANALCRADAANCEGYRSNYRALAAELNRLHRQLADELAPFRGESFFVFHPAWGHFAEAYGLHQVAVEHQGKSPNARHIAAFIEAMKSSGAQTLFVQPRSSNRGARTVAEAVDADLVTLDPLRRDLSANLGHVAQTLKRHLKPQ